MDFVTSEKINLEDFYREINEVLLRISIDFPFKPDKNAIIRNDRLQIFIKYDIIPEIVITKELKVDILKDFFISPYTERKIIFNYQDFKKNEKKLNTYTLESIASEKILRIIDVDKEARDIYDLWFLLKLNCLNVSNIKKSLEQRFGYKFYFPNLISEIKTPTFKKTWKIRLEKQVLNLPPYDLVIEELEKLIKKYFFNSAF